MIKEIVFNDISPYYSNAIKSGLTFCSNTKLYGLYVKDKLVGFTGILFQKKKVIFKNHCVLPDYRGNGYFKTLLNFSIDLTLSLNINVIEATCTEMSIKEYLKRDFKVIKQYKKYTKVKITI